MVRPKKHLGQHFLTDLTVVDRMVDTIDNLSVDELLEIGPGEGVLSHHLVSRYPKMRLIELDSESIEHLRATYPTLGNRLIEGDVLEWELPSGNWTIVGNFPYNISNQIMFKVFENRDQVQAVVGMFQKEVAERITANPGTKTYGILSVFIQAFYTAEYLFTVPENAFRPPPKVKSGVIKLQRNTIDKLECDMPFFISIVKQAFNQRRKMIRNSLKAYLNERNQKIIEKYLTMRPEQLHYEDFVNLARALKP